MKMADPTNTATPLFQRLLYSITNWALFIGGIVNLIVGSWYAAHADTTIAATSLTAGLVLLFAATIDRFESLKGLGVEAKTRKLDEKIEQADEALHKIRELAELTGAALIDLNSKIGRLNSAPTPRKSLALAEHVRSIMLRLGVEPAAMDSVLRPWAEMICGDLASFFAASIRKTVSLKINEIIMQRESISKPISADNPELARFNEDIKACNVFLDDLKSSYYFELEDYPKNFMSMFDDMPQRAQAELLPLREKAARFAADMTVLKRSMSLPNSETWIQILEEARRQG